jgi:hypothetical protein
MVNLPRAVPDGVTDVIVILDQCSMPRQVAGLSIDAPASHVYGNRQDNEWRERYNHGRTYALMTTGDVGDTSSHR